MIFSLNNHNKPLLEEINTSWQNFYSYFIFKSTKNCSFWNLQIKYLYLTVYVYVLLIKTLFIRKKSETSDCFSFYSTRLDTKISRSFNNYLKVQSNGPFPFLWYSILSHKISYKQIPTVHLFICFQDVRQTSQLTPDRVNAIIVHCIDTHWFIITLLWKHPN